MNSEDDGNEKREHEDESTEMSDETSLNVEMALLAIAASNDVGGPMGDFDLNSLSAVEKRALLAYMRHRFNLAPDPCDLSDHENCGKEPEASPPNSKAE